MKKVDADRWNLDFKLPNQHQALLDELAEAKFQPSDVVYCCGLAGLHSTFGIRATKEDLHQKLQASFYVPTFIVRALGRLGDPVNFSVVTRGLARVSDEPIDPLA